MQRVETTANQFQGPHSNFITNSLYIVCFCHVWCSLCQFQWFEDVSYANWLGSQIQFYWNFAANITIALIFRITKFPVVFLCSGKFSKCSVISLTGSSFCPFSLFFLGSEDPAILTWHWWCIRIQSLELKTGAKRPGTQPKHAVKASFIIPHKTNQNWLWEKI